MGSGMMVLLGVAASLAAFGMLAILVLMGVIFAIACFQSFKPSATLQCQKKYLSKKSNQDPESHPGESESEEAKKPRKFPAELNKLVQSMMISVAAQCGKAKDVFVILLLPHRELQDTKPNPSTRELAKVGSKDYTFSLEGHLSNHIAARSPGPENAEIIVLGKPDVPMEKIGEDKYKAIVLSSTSLPCDSEQERCKCAMVTPKEEISTPLQTSADAHSTDQQGKRSQRQ